MSFPIKQYGSGIEYIKGDLSMCTIHAPPSLNLQV